MPAPQKTLCAICTVLFFCQPLLFGTVAAAEAPSSPEKAHATVEAGVLSLSNGLLKARWSVRGHKFIGLDLTLNHQKPLALPRDAFSLRMKAGPHATASEMNLVGTPEIQVVKANAQAQRAAEQLPGQSLVLHLQDSQKRFAVTWRAILRDDSNYLREEVSISALGEDQPIQEVRMFDFRLPDARVVGSVKGSPVVAGDLFLGFEHPLAQCEVRETVVCGIQRDLPLKRGQLVGYSAVIGVAEPGQMRRSFLAYLEQERPRPYHPFLHYNTWYDIGFGQPYSAADVLDVIHAFGAELVRKRGVKLASFLLDDGWDNPDSLWSINTGFPNGFAPLISAARAYGAGVGIWLSPWGGYEEAKKKRLAYGQRNGFEINEGGFALSGPAYFARFRDVSCAFIREGANQFKVDGTGNVNTVFPGSNFDSDFAAAISLIHDWRALNPDLYVNLTTGTYPSPFWLLNADSIWRSGEDHSFAGVGSWREKWITYRDQQTYRGIVKAGPLFPLNSLMLHGLIYAKQAEHLDSDPGHDFANEIHSYFGSGTQLQEMYISHSLLSSDDWDALAEAANWSRRNAQVLRDTHWIGGDPGKLEVYGWAAWSPQKAILTLRNPGDHMQTYAIDVEAALELPPDASRRYSAHSPWKGDQNAASVTLEAGHSHTFTLRPFQVLNLELSPVH